MAEVSKYKFSIKEITESLIEKANLKEGLWQLEVEFRFAAAMAGASEGDQLPSAIASVSALGLVKVDKPGPKVVDAASIAGKQ